HGNGHEHYKNKHQVNDPAFELPGSPALVGKLSEGIPCSFSQASTSADPRTVPAFSVEVSENGSDDKDRQNSEDQHSDPQVPCGKKIVQFIVGEQVIVQG